MTPPAGAQPGPRGDQARAAVRVDVPPAQAFRVFTDEIDRWWLRGLAYRVAGLGNGTLRLEPRAGGRLLESIERDGTTREIVTGRITAWEPPRRLAFEWRAVNFAPDETTEVEVTFEPTGAATLVTVTHRGWASIRGDHPARHGKEVAAFLRMLGMWWGELLTSLRRYAAGASAQ